jgi:outer membrane protein TolC
MVSLQVSVSLPLFPGGRQDPLIGAKHQTLRRIEAERSDMLRDHTEALEGELADYAALQRQLDRSQDTHLTLATQKAEYLFASYQGGRSDLATALAARRELIATQLLQLDLRNRRDALAAQIYFSYLDSAP